MTAHLWEQKRKWEESEITQSFQTWEPKGEVVVTEGRGRDAPPGSRNVRLRREEQPD